MAAESTNPTTEYDPEFMERIVGLMEVYGRYFDAEVRGAEHFPESGGALLAGNHSGPNTDPDTPALMAAWYRKNGFEKPLTLLTWDLFINLPYAGDFARRIGQVAASVDNAEAALRAGGTVLVYPGGTEEVSRAWTDRNRIDFDGRKGFIKLALKQGVPVVPVVAHGGHESSIVLSRGRRLARLLRLDRVRLRSMPIIWTVPWGVVLGPVPSFPLPAKVTIQVCEPLDWSRFGPEAADDPEILERCYQEIVDIMQQTLDDLAKEYPFPILSRIGSLLTRRARGQ